MIAPPGGNSSGGGDLKSQVLAAVNIVELIGRTVALKQRGKDYVGLCPFHQEKSPSFHVSIAKQFFYCYGCKATGNAIDFVIKRDRVEFLDAMKSLAEQHGIEIPRYGQSREKSNERQQLLDANAAAVMFFEKQLADERTGTAAREYLAARGMNAASVKQFRLGLAIDAWDALVNSPVGAKFGKPMLVKAGLAKERVSEHGEVTGCYDAFRARVMFPIRDENARTIAFGGRALPGNDSPAKYLNSPETPLFSKSRSIFGIDLARQRIVETQTVAVVEGYTDVVLAHQHGVTNVVSVLGTALTRQHVAILQRFAKRIVLLFDADAAGERAVDRAVELFLTQPLEIAIASMPDGMDPDEFVIKNGAAAFEKLLADATDALAYKWRQLSQDFGNADDLTGRQQAVERYLDLLAGARNAGPIDGLRWGAALARVSRLTDIPVDQLHARFKRRSYNRPAPQRLESPMEGQNGDVPESLEQSAGSVPAASVGIPAYNLTAHDRAERWILGVLLAEPQRWDKIQQNVQLTDFTDPTRQRLAEVYWQHQRDEGEPAFNELLGGLRDEPAVAALAVELLNEVELLSASSPVEGEQNTLATIVRDAVAHLLETRRRVETRKLVADLRRTTDAPLPAEDEVELLQRLQTSAKRPDLRRG